MDKTRPETRLNTRVVVALLALTGLVIIMQLYLSIPLFPVMEQFFGVSRAAATWFGGAFGFAYAAGFLVFGPLSDRYGRKVIMIWGLISLAIVTLAAGFSPSFEVLIFLRIAQGLAAATFSPVALAYVGEVLPQAARATGIAFMTTGFLLAGILGQIYADVINAAFGWQWVFWSLAAAYLILFALVQQLPKGAPPAQGENILNVYINMARLFKRVALIAAYAASFTLLLTFVAMYTGLGRYLHTTYGMGQEEILWIRAAGIPGILLSPLAGRLIARFGSKQVVIGGLLVAVAGLVVEAFARQLPLIVVASGVFVAGIAVAVPALITLISITAGEARGAAVAFYAFILFVGASLGPFIAASLQPAGFTVLYGLLALSLTAAIVAITLGVRPEGGT